MYILLVMMVATSTEFTERSESFHSLLFSDYKIAIEDTTIKQQVNLWEKGPISLGRAVFIFPSPKSGRKKVMKP